MGEFSSFLRPNNILWCMYMLHFLHLIHPSDTRIVSISWFLWIMLHFIFRGSVLCTCSWLKHRFGSSPYYTKCDSGTSRLTITWELVRKAESQPHYRFPSDWCSTSKFEKYCSETQAITLGCEWAHECVFKWGYYICWQKGHLSLFLFYDN